MRGSGASPASSHPWQSRELSEAHTELQWSLFCRLSSLANTHWDVLVPGRHCLNPRETEMLVTRGSEAAVLFLPSVIPGGRHPLQNTLRGVFVHGEQCFSNRTPRNPEVPWTASRSEAGLSGPEEKSRETGSPEAKAAAFHFHSGPFVFICVLYVVVLHTASLTEGSAAF